MNHPREFGRSLLEFLNIDPDRPVTNIRIKVDFEHSDVVILIREIPKDWNKEVKQSIVCEELLIEIGKEGDG